MKNPKQILHYFCALMLLIKSLNLKMRLITIIFVAACVNLSAQTIKLKLNWLPSHDSYAGEQKIRVMNFEGAVFENPETSLPYYFTQVKTDNGAGAVSVMVVSETYEDIPETELRDIDHLDLLQTEIKISSSIATDRKQKFAQIWFVPLRISSSGKVQRLVSMELKIEVSLAAVQKSKARTYADHSVLSSGKWIKVRVAQTGVYKITYAQLQSMGFNSPQNPRVFGNGGKQLNAMNVEPRPDDLLENAIWIEKGQDGTFNSGDYILFYGEAPGEWYYDNSRGVYLHKLHGFSDNSYYYITDGSVSGKEIQTENGNPGTVTHNVNTFDDYAYYENELTNFIKSGQTWVGEYFNMVLSYDYNFYFAGLTSSEPAKIITQAYYRSYSPSTLSVTANGTLVNNLTFPGYNIGNVLGNYANVVQSIANYTPTSSAISVNLTYNQPVNGGEVWLDYLVLNTRRNLTFPGGQLTFRDIRSAATGNISKFSLAGSASNVMVWDITNPVEPRLIEGNLNGQVYEFTLGTDSLRHFVAMDGTSYLNAPVVGEVANQDLHGIDPVEYVIVTHPDFLSYANTLADLHRTMDGFTVQVVTPDVIYNEFSSGMTDPAAIRDYMKMLYDRAGSDPEKMPRYLLLFGDGSFDNRHTFSNNTNFLPTYQSTNSLAPTSSFVTDDFFAMLDDNEGSYIGLLDVGVGRIPVKSTAEASSVIQKIIRYVSDQAYGDWRNYICMIGDDEDNNQHMLQSDQMAERLDTVYPDYNVEKIFLDAFPQVTTPNGDRYPEVVAAINSRMEKGALILNYTGHGNETGLAHEHIIGISDISSWSNVYRMPLFVTATCEFSRFDDYNRTSAGESVLISPLGGGIGLFTTTRLVYSHSNFAINQSFYKYALERDTSYHFYRLGDIMRHAKNATASATDVNKRNFLLLGDPALTLSYPEYNVVTDSVNGIATDVFNDTLGALQMVVIKGHVENQGLLQTGYNGLIYPVVYDKPGTMSTLGNDVSNTISFSVQNNVLYKGKARVVNGYFEFAFIIPRDISYTIGKGKISYYTTDATNQDGNGYSREITIGGTSSDTTSDDTGPLVSLFMNNENFIDGGTTDENPKLLALLSDSLGINTVGNGIGHDITAVLDGSTSKTYVLNDYYEADLDSYQSGRVSFPFSSLENGEHIIRFKAWDILNNSSEAYIRFVVAEAGEFTLQNIFNYPNPFSSGTSFYFSHNQPNVTLDVSIQILTVSGKLVKTISTTLSSDSYQSTPIAWDGLDDYGEKIGNGVYIYRLRVKTQDGRQKEEYEKLVILH